MAAPEVSLMVRRLFYRTQHSRRTTIIKTRGRRPKRTVYEEFYEEEW